MLFSYLHLHLAPPSASVSKADGEVMPGGRGGGNEGKREVCEGGLPGGCGRAEPADRETASLSVSTSIC